ncbi:PRD domain-containing protein [Kroppenstedtia pulmonis]|uniref:PRD domain-containing protein n=1 Tax=Kroppenstedtia pulmonis TaxID=1380685 RepID=A0A7D3XRU0_9BACL|nr:PRD domain-containing protein [Kroppenstedtia pulmonis]QKG85482.1 PRD domain-containing protein [Kroppenstedtia pulmonis]
MLPEEVKERLDLLVDSKQIEVDTRQRVWETLTQLEQQGHLDPESDSIGPFTNHLAIAATRITRGEAITESNNQVDEVLRENPELIQKAEAILEQCVGNSETKIPSAETGFIVLYLALLRKQPNEEI